MNESQIEDGLRNLALLEPDLGFDPDEVAGRAAKRQKARSMALIGGVATAIIALTTAGMVVVSGKEDAAPPAVQETVTPLERNKRHFEKVAPKVMTGLRDFAIFGDGSPHYVGNPQGSLLMGAGFRDRYGVGKTFVGITDSLPKNQQYPTLGECRSGSVALYGKCRLITLGDNSVVVVASSSNEKTVGALGIHHRNDGTYVVVTNNSGDTRKGSEPLKPSAVAEDEAIALATDPAFSLR